MLIPKEWLSKVKMARVICHWSAGAYKPSDLDKEHYHILIDGDGALVRGRHSIADNVDCTDSNYAAHTGEMNTGSIGVSMCCMFQANETAHNMGSCPMKAKQWDTLCQVVAELCTAYAIPVTPFTVLGHGEVHDAFHTHGNTGKWDPMVLPFRPELSKKQVGELLRSTVQSHLHPTPTPPEVPPTAKVVIQGKTFTDAFFNDEHLFVKARPVAEAFGFDIQATGDEAVTVTRDGESFTIPAQERNNSRFVAVREIADTFGLNLAWDKVTRTATLT